MWIVPLVLLTSTASAFTTTTTRATKNVSVSQEENRRQFFVGNTMKVLSFLLLPVSSSSANASLLDDYGSNPTKQMKQTVEALRQQREIDPTLRGSYYYPTAKKRYLPRIKKVSDSLNSNNDDAATIPFSSIRSMEDWQNISNFCNGEADGAILPLKLYQSSLTGQGLSMSTSYSKVMKRDATSFESAVRDLHHAIQSKDEERAIRSISNLRIALNEYRDVGRLTGPDWGDDIPSVDDVRRMTMRHPTIKILDR